MSLYSDDDLLMLSGIQHIAFCERQWALIHLEQAWAENVRTIEGHHLHERTDDPFDNETRKNIRVVRALPIVSYSLGLRGIADVVEFHRGEIYIENVNIEIEKRKGWWQPYPVEYKRGWPKHNDCDVVQLCAQAMAIEEMLSIRIDKGFLFYAQTKHRTEIVLEQSIREHVKDLSMKMHIMFKEAKTPRPKKGKHCASCSILEICQPDIISHHKSITAYLKRMVDMEVEKQCGGF